MKIRFANETDIPAIKQLIDINFDEVISKHHSPAVVKKFKKYNSIESLKSQLVWKTVYVAVVDNQIIATGALANFGTPCSPKYSVSNFYVLPQLHKKGIGTKLINKLIKLAKEHSAAAFHVPSTRNAVPFYEKSGFIVDTDQPEAKDEITWMTLIFKGRERNQ